VGEAHYAHCNCCIIKVCQRRVYRGDAPEGALTNMRRVVYYKMTLSIAQTPQGQMPAQMPQPMQYFSSETYS